MSVVSIVVALGLETVINLFDRRIRMEERHMYEAKARAIIEEVGNRLQEAIPESVVALNPTNRALCRSLMAAGANNQFTTLAWVGVDMEGHRGAWDGAYMMPGWSGWVNLAASIKGATSVIATPGSDLNTLQVIHTALGGNLVGSGLYFQGGGRWDQACSDFGFDGGGADRIYTVGAVDVANKSLTVNGTTADTRLKEAYKLARTAYAVELDAAQNLWLFYNFRPWAKERPEEGMKVLLGDRVSGFGFSHEGGMVRINVCVGGDNQAETIFDDRLTVCKERVIVP